MIKRCLKYPNNIIKNIIIKNVFINKIVFITRSVFRAYRKRNGWEYLAVHNSSLTELPSFFVLPFLCGHVKGKLRCPPEITILLVHNYKKESVMEKSLRYVGIENFVVLKVDPSILWRNTHKLKEIKSFLDSGRCKTEYILFFDSVDAVLRDEPEKAIRYLQEEGCDLLFSSTSYNGGYKSIPEMKEWTDRIAKESGYGERYLNCGVYVAKTSFLREVMDAAMEYITEDAISRGEHEELLQKEGSLEKLPPFPKGVWSDQVILRYLHRQFYPRMKIDYKNRLALRT